MIIKFNSLYSLTKQVEETVPKKLTIDDRIKGDRLVMLILIILTIIFATIFA